MKKIILKILWGILRAEAWVVLKLKKPKIIAVTGSIGKTSTKDAIWWVLKKDYFVGKSPGNVNAEFGVPLTILGYKKEKGPGKLQMLYLPFWGKAMMLKNIFSNYPKILVIEMGIENQGDIKYFTKLAKPNISVITAVSPVHLDSFKNVEGVYQEKADLVKILDKNDWAVLNQSDERVAKMAKLTPAKIKYFSTETGNIYREAAKVVAEIFSIKDAEERLKDFSLPKGRMNIIKKSNYTIIDDSYNSNPLAAKSALLELKKMDGKRKLAILGDMLEQGDYTKDGHYNIGKLAGKICDEIVFVGHYADFFFAGAKDNLKDNLDVEYIHKTKNASEATKKLLKIIKPGDVVLVKGSRGVGLEKVVNYLRNTKTYENTKSISYINTKKN